MLCLVIIIALAIIAGFAFNSFCAFAVLWPCALFANCFFDCTIAFKQVVGMALLFGFIGTGYLVISGKFTQRAWANIRKKEADKIKKILR